MHNGSMNKYRGFMGYELFSRCTRLSLYKVHTVIAGAHDYLYIRCTRLLYTKQVLKSCDCTNASISHSLSVCLIGIYKKMPAWQHNRSTGRHKTVIAAYRLQAHALTHVSRRADKNSLLLLSELAVRTEHIHNLVDVHLLHVLTSWLQVLTWVEVTWVLSEVLADSSSHGET